MDAVGINWPGLLTQLISFLILFLLLKKFLYRPVIKMLEDRAEKIKTSLEAADKVKQEAEQTTAANESLMLKAREESQALISESREQAKKIKESELEKSKLQIEIERKRALDEIRSEEDKIINNIRSEFSGLAISAAEKIIEREVNENNHKEIIQLFLEKAKNIKS
ncbi:MAG TPA: ATP synthase F0 subunit B [Nitrososphaerales archaeon]|nr:ATP synthase F0 subunit B [Nitrososphaerales archaeon]